MNAEDFQQNYEHGGYPIVVMKEPRSMTVRTMLVLIPVGAVVIAAYWGIKLFW